MKNDPFGKAALDYLSGKKDNQILVKSDIAEDDFIPVNYLFRSFHQMPDIEQKALMLCKGRVLDIGAGVGSHALYLQNKGLAVDCIDTSIGCKQAALQRGVKNYVTSDFFEFESENKYDTLLLMMNGIGLAKTIDELPTFFAQVKKLLASGGQIILDSSDLRYLFMDEDSDIIPSDEEYYGEVSYSMSYEDQKSDQFKWLFIDAALLSQEAYKNGFSFEKIADGPHYDYLARLQLL
ncbi:class I SAM-dependent methyltransferase [Carboxylicivirga sp. N1Y90]|uniref:class I SAM-dependent methyltransferase n=1 Tax=Carboxylicivirga fragile TaxID=3417571 RepID=UPI003D32FEC6|nr:class I SAM-dependent methyltransferase [Marinilabiliaceae bacterium N1Y90]